MLRRLLLAAWLAVAAALPAHAQIVSGSGRPSSSAPIPNGYIVGNWIHPWINVPYTGVTQQNTAKCYLAYFLRNVTIDGLGDRLTTTAAGNFGLAIYANNPSTGRPTGNPLISAVGITTNSSGFQSATSLTPVTLSAFTLYQFCGVTDNATAILASGSGGDFESSFFGSSTGGNLTGSTAIYLTGSQATMTYSGGWVDAGTLTWTDIAGNTSSPFVAVHISALP